MRAGTATGAVASIAVSLYVIFGKIRGGHWGELAFAAGGTAVIVAGAWVYAVLWARRERRRAL